MKLCKIALEEHSNCDKCCKYCDKYCNERCVFDKYNQSCDNEVLARNCLNCSNSYSEEGER